MCAGDSVFCYEGTSLAYSVDFLVDIYLFDIPSPYDPVTSCFIIVNRFCSWEDGKGAGGKYLVGIGGMSIESKFRPGRAYFCMFRASMFSLAYM